MDPSSSKYALLIRSENFDSVKVGSEIIVTDMVSVLMIGIELSHFGQSTIGEIVLILVIVSPPYAKSDVSTVKPSNLSFVKVKSCQLVQSVLSSFAILPSYSKNLRPSKPSDPPESPQIERLVKSLDKSISSIASSRSFEP